MHHFILDLIKQKKSSLVLILATFTDTSQRSLNISYAVVLLGYMHVGLLIHSTVQSPWFCSSTRFSFSNIIFFLDFKMKNNSHHFLTQKLTSLMTSSYQ